MAEPAVAPRLHRQNTLSIPINPDGSIDWESISEDQQEKFKEVISNDPVSFETLAASLGDVSENPPELEEGLTEANVGAFLDSVCKANAILFAILLPKFKKHPLLIDTKTRQPLPFIIEPDTALHCFKLSEEQHKELDPRALRVAKKYSSNMPEWLKKNFDLYMLCGMFLSYTVTNAQMAMNLQLQRDLRRATNPPTAPQSRPPDSDASAAFHAPPPPVQTSPSPSNGSAKVEGESLESAAMAHNDGPPPPIPPGMIAAEEQPRV